MDYLIKGGNYCFNFGKYNETNNYWDTVKYKSRKILKVQESIDEGDVVEGYVVSNQNGRLFPTRDGVVVSDYRGTIIYKDVNSAIYDRDNRSFLFTNVYRVKLTKSSMKILASI